MSTANYVTKTDLSNYTKKVLALLGERDTKITKNTDDILLLQAELDALDTGLHYEGVTAIVPEDPEDQALYYFQVPSTETSEAITGWRFWSDRDSTWNTIGSSSGGGISADDFATKAIDFTTEIGQL